MGNYSITALLRSKGSIILNKDLVHAIGNSEATLYSELCSKHEWFKDHNMLDDEGYFYNTQYDLQAATGLGEKAQRTTIIRLKNLGLIKYELKGVPSKRHFKIIEDNEKLLNILEEGHKKLKALENSSDTSVGGNLKRRGKEQAKAEGSANNTNNNTNHNTKPYIGINAEGVNKYFSLYHETFRKHHREFKGDPQALEIFTVEELDKYVLEFFEEQKYIPSKCTLDYFLFVIETRY